MPRVKLFNEEDVLKKAMDLFWKKGYHATSVQDLVDHLGINRASLYSTYGGKKDLFDKAFSKYRKINSEGVSAFLNKQSDVKKGLRTLFETAIDESIADTDKKGCFVVNTTTELIPGDDNMVKMLENNKKIIENIFYQYLKEGKTNGQLKTKQDLKALASLIYTIYTGLRVVSKVNPSKKKLKDSVYVALSLLD